MPPRNFIFKISNIHKGVIFMPANRLTHEEFLERVKKTNPYYNDFEFLSEYTVCDNRIKVKCKKCGHLWEPKAKALSYDMQGCPKCHSAPKLTHEEFLKRVKKTNPYYNDFEFLTECTGSKNRIKVRCKKCGHIWEPKVYNLSYSKQGCPKCHTSATSFMEQFLYNSFCEVLGKENIINRDKSAIGKELDIYIPDKKFAIEIGSWFWHKDIFEKDLEKYKLCQDKGIKLLIIYDNCKDFPKDINYDFIWTYDIDLGLEKDLITLKEIFYKCSYILSINNLNYINWKIIEGESYKDSYRKSHKEFIEEFKNKNKYFNNIKINSIYKGRHERIDCECKICGYKWSPIIDNLLQGKGCRKCHTNKISKKSEVLEWQKNNPLGNRNRCSKETGISLTTVWRWWDYTFK